MDFDLVCDIELVKARIANLDREVSRAASKEMNRAAKSAAEVVKDEWQSRVPKRSGKLAAGGRAGATARKGGYVNIAKAGPPYAMVQEFGGTIPRYHSNKRTLVKPWIGGRGGTSYFLYPARDDKMSEVRDKWMGGVQDVCDKYLPSRGNG